MKDFKDAINALSEEEIKQLADQINSVLRDPQQELEEALKDPEAVQSLAYQIDLILNPEKDIYGEIQYRLDTEDHEEVIEEYIHEATDELAEIAKMSDPKLMIEILDALENEMYYEHMMDVILATDRTLLETYTELFTEYRSVSAIKYGLEHNLPELVDEAISNLDEDWEEDAQFPFLEAYRLLVKHNDLTGIKRLWKDKKIPELKEFGEIHQLAIEVGDQYTMSRMADDMEEEYEEALLLAYEAEDHKVIKEIEDFLEEQAPNLHKYERLVGTAEYIVEAVREGLGLNLPERIIVGGPKGSYASIRYKEFTGNVRTKTRDAA